MTTKVPFADLHAQYLSIQEPIDSAIASVIRESAFIRGRFVDDFEAEFARALGIAHCVSCANGTDSLYIAMRALGIKAGDEVIAPAHSWISTTETITQAGGKVVFCDTDRDTFTIDPEALAEKVTERTVGIIPVHLYGQAADMEPIVRIARKHGLWVLEDCAQAHLATYRGELVGTIGNVGSFSFYPGKNLGAMGDAGAVVTNSRHLADAMATIARHGGLKKGEHKIEGVNSRLDGLQAAILSVKLNRLAEWTARRQEIAGTYGQKFAEVAGVLTPRVAPDRGHVYHLYVIRHERRDELATHLKEHGVQTVVNYPVALPFLPAYSRLGHRPEDFPNAHHNQSRILSLPIYPEMTDGQIDEVVEAVRSFKG